MLIKCTNLNHLHLKCFYTENISLKSLIEIEHNFSKIIRLDFNDSQKVLRDFFIDRCQKTLKTLIVSNSGEFRLSDLNGELELPLLPNLERLKCIGSKIKPTNLPLLLNSSPNLKSLEIEINKFQESYEEFLDYLERKRGSYKLTHLTISGSKRLREGEKERFTNLRLQKLIFE